MTQAKALAKHSGRGAFYHRIHKGVVGLGVHAGSPWDRLAAILSNPDFSRWPTDGWILTMELRCPHCHETRLVEIVQSHRGDRILCAVCGRDASSVTPADGPIPASGPTGPS